MSERRIECEVRILRCLMCGHEEGLTKHHLLKRRSAQRVGRNLTVKLCRPCHNRFHQGSSQSRREAWDELLPLLTDDERSVREHSDRLPELWERRAIA